MHHSEPLGESGTIMTGAVIGSQVVLTWTSFGGYEYPTKLAVLDKCQF